MTGTFKLSLTGIYIKRNFQFKLLMLNISTKLNTFLFFNLKFKEVYPNQWFESFENRINAIKVVFNI